MAGSTGARVRIVKIQHVRADAVEQRGVQYVHAFAAAQQASLRRTGKIGERRQRALDRLVTRAADRAAGPVQKRARRFVLHGLRNIGESRADEVAGERARDFSHSALTPAAFIVRDHLSMSALILA